MRTLNFVIMSLLMGLTLLFGVVASAQTETKKQSDSCCSSCCRGDSCDMKGMKNHGDKKDCCRGDSCDMKGMENHGDKKGCCCRDSCDMKMGETKSHAAKDMKGCSCCSDSCDMKPPSM